MVMRCSFVVRCYGLLPFGLLKSGIPNLIWRTNRRSDLWLVKLNVLKGVQGQLPLRTGKLTFRLQ